FHDLLPCRRSMISADVRGEESSHTMFITSHSASEILGTCIGSPSRPFISFKITYVVHTSKYYTCNPICQEHKTGLPVSHLNTYSEECGFIFLATISPPTPSEGI